MYSENALASLSEFADRYGREAQQLRERLILFKFKNEDAAIYAKNGAARRLGTLAGSIAMVFDSIAPNLDEEPDETSKETATIGVQHFVNNVYGFLDNIAHIWNSEMLPVNKNGEPFPRKYIGLLKSNKSFRRVLPDELKKKLTGYNGLFEDAKEIRDHLGHGLPLYIVPFFLTPEEGKRYQELEEQKWEAAFLGNVDLSNRLREEQNALGRFVPVASHDLRSSRPYYFHALLWSLFDALIVVGNELLEELERQNQSV